MGPQPHQTEADAPVVGHRGYERGAALAGVAVAAVLVWAWWSDPVVWLMPATGILVVAAAAIDWRTKRIPNRLTLAALVVLGPVVAALAIQDLVQWREVLGGVGLMAGPLLGANLVTRSHMPGLGDVKLAGLLGITLGAVSPSAAYAALLGSLVLGAGFGMVYRARTGARSFPLAPAISGATVLVLALSGLSLGGE